VDPSGLYAAIAKGQQVVQRVAPYADKIYKAIRSAFGLASRVPVGTILDTTGLPHAPVTMISSRESVKVVEGVTVKGENGKCGNSNKNKGDCGEALANAAYERAGYKTVKTDKMTNKSGHGIDNVAYNDTEVVVIETKANSSRLSKAQKLGGKKYLDKQLTEMIRGLKKGEGRWASYEDSPELKDAIGEITDLLKNKKSQFKICRVILDDDPSGCYGKGGNGKCEGEVKCEINW